MISQSFILSAFNQRVEELVKHIRIISDQNPDPEMAANKTKRIIDKWFRNGGKLPRV